MTEVTLRLLPPARPGLGRHVEHDPRSLAYAVEAPTGAETLRPVLWPRLSPILDQGSLGSCTGNAMAGWLGSAPHATDPAQAAQYNEACAVQLYSDATRLDRWPGEYPPDDTGSSGLAVCKAAKRAGLISSYRWCFSTRAVKRALQHGPVLFGTVWLSDMFNPGPDGYLEVSGAVEGGHEYLCRGWVDGPGGGHFVCDNSWGEGWGKAGSFLLRVADWEKLRKMQADVAVPIA